MKLTLFPNNNINNYILIFDFLLCIIRPPFDSHKFDFVETLRNNKVKDFESLTSSCTITIHHIINLYFCMHNIDDGEINTSSTCRLNFVSRVLVHKSLNNSGYCILNF